ncbi:MAG: HIT family protein [Rhodocyclaceae bacterium]|jgi:diadenosine tetraphosphate (Ap4A) HIT family hydrolase|nr:HIT family protein [Rhodocyclaceae bacterium]MCL4759908.1 HIT family protein [Rhodocyclaceae bacterium]
MSEAVDCPLCDARGEHVLWRDRHCRVVFIPDPDYPGYCRVIWNDHIVELSDLIPEERTWLLEVVCATETALRELMRPDKINLASLGNQVPHLHWHVIPRHRDDAHFPQPIWGTRQREGRIRPGPEPDQIAVRLAQLNDRGGERRP